MQKHLFTVILSIIAVALAGCSEEVDAPLQLDVIENTAPDITDVRYFSPSMGPGWHEKEYHVYTDFSACELKLQCNNCNLIQIETALTKPYVPPTGGNSSTEATPDETGIHVTLSEGNIITVRFTELEPQDNPYGYFGTVTVYGIVNRENKKTIINIARRNPNLDNLQPTAE